MRQGPSRRDKINDSVNTRWQCYSVERVILNNVLHIYDYTPLCDSAFIYYISTDITANLMQWVSVSHESLT